MSPKTFRLLPLFAVLLHLFPAWCYSELPDAASPLVSYQYLENAAEVPAQPSVASPLISYQFHDTLTSNPQDPSVSSPLVSYQFRDSLTAIPDAPSITSPLVSYLFRDTPDPSSLTFDFSPLVSYRFGLETVNPEAATLTITGSGSISAGSSMAFQCYLHLNDGSPPLDVSNDPETDWNVFGQGLNPPNATLFGNTLSSGVVDAPTQVSLQAAYRGNTGGVVSPLFPVTIEPSFSTAMVFNREFNSGTSQWDIFFTASSHGGTAPVTYHWDLNGDGEFDDAAGQEATFVYGASGNSIIVGVKAIDSVGATAVHRKELTINKPLAPEERPWRYPASAPYLGDVLDSSGDRLTLTEAGTEAGLIILTHGLNGSGREQWLKDMRNAIIARLQTDNVPIPNIAIYGWEDGADPTRYSRPDRIPGVLFDTFFGDLKGLLDLNELYDIWRIRPIAQSHGERLADWIIAETQTDPPHIDITKPIHLIGHSAGGFVMGECALRLKNYHNAEIDGIDVDLVTSLDTPFPLKSHFVDFPNPGTIERYISSLYGVAAPALELIPSYETWRDSGELFVEPTSYYRRELVPINPILNPAEFFVPNAGHSYSHEWYLQETIRTNGSSETGFNRSPFLSWNSPAPVSPTSLAASSEIELSNDAIIPSVPVTEFSTFGQVSEAGGTYTLTESNNAGIYADIEIPVGATEFRFRYQFTTPGDGDFVSIHLDDELQYVGSELSLNRENFLETSIPLELLRGVSGVLTFTLVSRGEPNAVLEIEPLGFTVVDDPDLDGLTTTEEEAIGTNPLTDDTDGDGVTDQVELNVLMTDPLLPDTDGDGQNDADEVIAKTDPKNSNDFIQITKLKRNPDSSISLEWPSKIDATYRIFRSEDLEKKSYFLIGDPITGIAPEASVTDPSPPDSGSFFYWIQVE